MTDYSRERPGDDLPYETLLLERLPVVVERAFAQSFLAEMDALPEIKVEVFDDALGNMVVQLRAYMLAERLADQTAEVRVQGSAYFRFPTNPWQHLKQRFAPHWFQDRWPVKKEYHEQPWSASRTIHVKQFATFPMSPLRTPKKQQGSLVSRYETVVVPAVDF